MQRPPLAKGGTSSVNKGNWPVERNQSQGREVCLHNTLRSFTKTAQKETSAEEDSNSRFSPKLGAISTMNLSNPIKKMKDTTKRRNDSRVYRSDSH